ncbi:hypothetical protein N657DRAFT_57199 [Parathielavia appendiculata]|uniref:Uncharacterized protein n=1 Tax=Parathielavia appendiculata TaxID=2587402 RepID=A0AAN6Z807_9PEZI|nr:hypothetical protein N657DRAFT_57199 [Parathielavia appendiculata]
MCIVQRHNCQDCPPLCSPRVLLFRAPSSVPMEKSLSCNSPHSCLPISTLSEQNCPESHLISTSPSPQRNGTTQGAATMISAFLLCALVVGEACSKRGIPEWRCDAQRWRSLRV